MRCLVTGAAGFIGNALVKRLVNEGYEVIGLIHYREPKYHEKKVKYVTGDITELDSIKPLVKDIDIVFHCAALVKDYGPKEIFYRVNIEGTKNLVAACEEFDIKMFVFLGHIRYESKKNIGYYSKTKALAEQYLMEKYHQDKFPVVIIRPGHVYGPGATTWVLTPLKAIQKNRFALIDHGSGIFLHTYIDNLLDALISTIKELGVAGEIIDITDGDNDTLWGEYLISLAKMTGKKTIKRNLSKKTAFFLGRLMMIGYRLLRIEPWVTPMAVEVFTNKKTVSIERAESLLGYKPVINFEEGMEKVRKWLYDEGYVDYCNR